MKKILVPWLLALALLIVGPFSRPALAEADPYAYSVETAEPVAENLTRRCRITSDMTTTAYAWRLTDGDLRSSQTFVAGKRVSLAWTDEVPVKVVYLAFRDYPKAYRIQQFDAEGALIKEEPGFWNINHAVFLEEGTRAVTVVPDSKVTICSFYAYGEGTIPGYHPWEPTPEKLDYLIVAMHPDDDVLFMGAILPLYTVDQGREGSVFYTAAQDRVRKDEALNGAWIMGLRKSPILGEFRDISPKKREELRDAFPEDKLVLYLVRLFRQYRPEVVFTHDVDGEYGHWQHSLLSDAVQKAVPLAANAEYDPRSMKTYGAWQIKKLYLHLYEENRISLPVEKPIDAYGGLTPVEIATAAFECHQSQLPSTHAVRNEGVYSLSDFGLAYTTVGPDTPDVNDPFEHIDPMTLHSLNGTPAATSAPAPVETPVPTDAPAPAETTTPWRKLVSFVVQALRAAKGE